MATLDVGRPLIWGADSKEGQFLRELIRIKETWQEIVGAINERYDTDYTYTGIRSAAYRQGLTLQNRELALSRHEEIQDRYGIVDHHSIPIYPIHDTREWVPVVYLGDMHVGNDEFLEDVLDKYIDFAISEKAYIIGMGDWAESAIPGHMPQTMWGQRTTPERQQEYLEKKFKTAGLNERIITILNGNHENRITRTTSTHVLAKVAELLNCLHQPKGGMINLRFANTDYLCFNKHGNTGGDYRREVLAWASQNPEADVIAVGHLHNIAAFDINEHFVMETVSGENGEYLRRKAKVQLGLRTGHCLDFAGYVDDAVPFRPQRTGFPIVWFNTIEKNTIADTSGNFITP